MLHKITSVVGFSLVALTGATYAAYTPTSKWVNQPETILPYIQEAADFWIKAYDTEYGGFFSNVGLTGTPTDQNVKATLIQGRNTYAMAKAFMVTGDEKYLPYGEGATTFLNTYGWDETNLGWYGLNDRTGNLYNPGNLSWANNKWSFWQHYNLIGTESMLEVTGEQKYADWLARGNAVNDEILWDDTPGQEGYFAGSSGLAWQNLSGKGFTPTVDAMTTQATYNYLLDRSQFRYERMLAVADNINDYLVGSMTASGVVAGFPSEFDTAWKINTSKTSTSIGHMIKTAWCLARANLLSGDDKYQASAEKLLDHVIAWKAGTSGAMFDLTKGVPKGEINWKTGNTSGTGDWWTVEQAFTSGMMNYYISGKDSYLKMADNAIDFWMGEYDTVGKKYIRQGYWDYVNKECYSVVTPSGTVTSNEKGALFKGGYHSTELLYYVYLYSNLYYHKKPVQLHYKWSASETDKQYALWPLEIQDAKLKITGVQTKSGVALTSFDANTRTVTIPAGMGGVFKVTYENLDTAPTSNNAWGLLSGSDAVWTWTYPGWVYYSSAWYPWSYSVDLGWLYSFTNKPGAAWQYVASLGDIVYTSAEIYPYAYSANHGKWLRHETDGWYLNESGNTWTKL
ncbi:MAG: hypothetical protein SFY80_04600 [Verrucomicrobiota bacterium]|nr:hypothetical protein [Verrucomicrobiota bacterium]